MSISLNPAANVDQEDDEDEGLVLKKLISEISLKEVVEDENVEVLLHGKLVFKLTLDCLEQIYT